MNSSTTPAVALGVPVAALHATAQPKNLNRSPKCRAREQASLSNFGFRPSRWGSNPDEKIGRHSLRHLLSRYAITILPGSDEQPPSVCINMLEIDQEMDLLSAVDVANYLRRILAESWWCSRASRKVKSDPNQSARAPKHDRGMKDGGGL